MYDCRSVMHPTFVSTESTGIGLLWRGFNQYRSFRALVYIKLHNQNIQRTNAGICNRKYVRTKELALASHGKLKISAERFSPEMFLCC
jgi:hypothetical protein